MEEEKYIEERVGKRNPFLVPEGYFEHLADQVMASLPEQQTSKQQPKAKRISIRSLYYYAAAAVCALVISVAVWQAFPGSSQQVAVQTPVAYQEPSDADFEEAADYIMLDNNEIYSLLADN